ncbi:MAG: hypothetical protein E7020_00315 [Alphaproteobacteria bacterium]|nr:hypothetical protein [Alphaproteobacteria bacterium]
MFSWILIAFVIALIFGVIKIEQLKMLATKIEPKARELFSKAQKWTEAKTAEIKASTNKKATSDKTTTEENTENKE